MDCALEETLINKITHMKNSLALKHWCNIWLLGMFWINTQYPQGIIYYSISMSYEWWKDLHFWCLEWDIFLIDLLSASFLFKSLATFTKNFLIHIVINITGSKINTTQGVLKQHNINIAIYLNNLYKIETFHVFKISWSKYLLSCHTSINK